MKASHFPRAYRAYNPIENRMLSVEELTKRGFSITPDGLPSCASENLLDVIVMWFSGKIDRKGQHIFESDICKVEIANEFGSLVVDYGKMMWNNDLGQFLLMIPSMAGTQILTVKSFELVGNEFENPELVPLVQNNPPQS